MIMIVRKICILLVFVLIEGVAFGHLPPDIKKQKVRDIVQLRNDCNPATQAVDMDINNVRARLRVGGDLWWDGQGEGRYIVPKPAPGFPEVSAIFAGGVWLGGLDPAGNLKAAITQYPSGNVTDFWPGPLDLSGATESDVCVSWDRFFELDGDNVRRHNANFDQNGDIDCDDIPDDVKYWPGRGNPYWAERFSFDLPDQNLGYFWDEDNDGRYDPCMGDFPAINIRKCEPADRLEAKELVPDEMIFWIYNDAGNTHLESGADQIGMEIQVQAFAYATNDEINDMTFLRYRLINKAVEDIQDCYFAMWVDPDLGCFEDDYIGCDVDRSLAIVYNEDAIDGNVGDACTGGINTYGSNIPLLGIDYFRGPRGPKIFLRDDDGNLILTPEGDTIFVDPIPGTGDSDTLLELGMTSFMYTNNAGIGDPPPGTTDPQNGEQAYNVLTGLWPDGNIVTVGATGYNDGVDTTRYIFPGDPSDDTQWSMCSADLPFGDRRTIQATGPILLQAGGQDEELIVGIPFVPDVDYPCPSFARLQFADDIAQALFDACFDITDGPDAPDMYGIELDRQIILLLANDSLLTNSNNAKQQYEEVDLQAPMTAEDNLYRFEGYQVYQLSDPGVSVQQLDDPSKAQVIRQVDIKNGVSTITNYVGVFDPTTRDVIFVPEVEPEVNGSDRGLQNSFNVFEDRFASGDNTNLVNHTDYYFLVVAYAYNNFEDYRVNDQVGQRRPYLEGRGNIEVYTFTPRPQVYQELQAAYGQEAEITRISGVGTGFNALDMVDGTYDEILSGDFNGEITYKAGNGPISVKVVDPLNIKDGNYRLEIIGDYIDSKANGQPRFPFEGGQVLAPGARWKLTNLDTEEELFSELPIEIANEQIIYQQGFSVSVNQSSEPGENVDANNGAIDQSFEYVDEDPVQWWQAARAREGFPILGADGESDGNVFSFARADTGLDSVASLTNNGTAFFTPLQLTRFGGADDVFYLSPSWRGQYPTAEQDGLDFRATLENLNNVDIVFTADKSKWSRCIVVETAPPLYEASGLLTEGTANQFALRAGASVNREGNPDGDGTGMGWFPGYAIDVETGQRLNIFFGENSVYTDELSIDAVGDASLGIGDDMIWNPTSDVIVSDISTPGTFYRNFGGGQHYIYVTRTPYDESASLRDLLSVPANAELFQIAKLMDLITYTAVPLPARPLLPVSEGLIPSDAIAKVRVENSFNKEIVIQNIERPVRMLGEGSLPVYEFGFSGVEPRAYEGEELESALADVAIVPNPYYAYSAYETDQFETTIKVTNLPARATVTIYSLDGKFIRRFERSESPLIQEGSNPAIAEAQIYPALEWDLNNSSNVPVASGVYIFHISAPGIGERSIKWFGVNRKFDPTGL